MRKLAGNVIRLFPGFTNSGANFTAIFLFVAAIAGMPAVMQPYFARANWREAASAFHTVAETIYVAAVAAMFFVSWYAPRGKCRLRPMVVACICASLIAFSLFHVLTYPGMLSFSVTGASYMWFYFGRLGHVMLPLALFALAFLPGHIVLSARLRWSLFSATLAWMAPVVWYVFSHSAELPEIFGDDGTLTASARTMLVASVALHVGVALVVARFGNMDRSETRYSVLAAMTGALSEALVIAGGGEAGTFGQLAHAIAPVSVAAAFSAIYGEAISIPYSAMEGARVAALMDKERLEAVFRSIADGVIVVDEWLTVRAMNPVAQHLLGKRDERCSGQPLSPLLEAVDMGASRTIVADIKQALKEGRSVRAKNRTATWLLGGSNVVVEYAISPSYDREGAVQGAVLVVRDVTERWRLQEDLRSAADYARNLIEASLDPMIAVDLDGLISDVNRATENVTGVSRGSLIGTRFSSYFSTPDVVRDALKRVLSTGAVRDLSLVLLQPDGRSTEISCNITPYQGPDGRVRGVFAVARDVTDVRLVQKQLEFQASRDPLTALPNRRLFRERIERGMALARNQDRRVAVLLIDIDDFKDVNDTRGHLVGDDLLQCIAQRLVEALRECDTVARIGGDEFGVLIEDLTAGEDVCPFAEKLLSAVTTPMFLDDSELNVSCSIGISIFPDDSESTDILLRNADTAMYRAKEAGKNNYQCFTSDMNAAVQRRVDLGNRLRGALSRSEFSLQYQPQVDLEAGTIIGVEALLRWDSEGLGAVSPAEFIPVAEDTGLILPIGRWVLHEACSQAVSWYRQFGFYVSVAVNLSARQFRDGDIVAEIENALMVTGLPPALLELELTESLLVRDPSRVAETLRSLKTLGVTIAIDDFGTGYSSLSYLKQFPLDYLKIDRSFVADVPGDRNDEAIVRSIIALSHSLGLKVIAEGVETREQMNFLHSQGCNEIQGYLVSRPKRVADMLDFLGRSGEFKPAFSPQAANALTEEGRS